MNSLCEYNISTSGDLTKANWLAGHPIVRVMHRALLTPNLTAPGSARRRHCAPEQVT